MALARECVPAFKTDERLRNYLGEYHWRIYRNDCRGKNAQKAWERFFKNNKEVREEQTWSQYRAHLNAKYAEAELQQKIDEAIRSDSATSERLRSSETHMMPLGTN